MLHDFTLNLWSGNADQISVKTYLTGSPPPPDAAALGCVDPPDQADAVVKPQRGPMYGPEPLAGPGPGPFAVYGRPQKKRFLEKQHTIYSQNKACLLRVLYIASYTTGV